ncbi:hypothetical protein PINS_up005034 [Pythium insidiosum]|nr:hypothetical protein PINS_up005034 [Pythium insidiosum]
MASTASGATPPRWRAAPSVSMASTPSSHQINSTNRVVLQLEKRLRSNEAAAKHVKDAQLEETLAALRQKAANLWTDQWMYEDPAI